MDAPTPNLAIVDGKTQWRNNLYTNVLKGSPAGGGFSTQVAHPELMITSACRQRMDILL